MSGAVPAADCVRRRLALLVSVAGAMIVALDGTVLLVAQPSLGHELGASVAQVQWTSTSYLVAVAALLVVAGRLGDRYGHPRMLFLGVLGFAAASAGIALAPGIRWVIALRAVQGMFGALLQPATLALLRLTYPVNRLAGPIAVRTSAIGIAGAAGPVLGGVLVAHLGWRAVFVVNVPVALAIAAITRAVRAPSVPGPGPRRLDVTGAALLAIMLGVLVHTLVGVPTHGWVGAPTLLGVAVVVAVAVALVGHERRSPDPIVPAVVARSVPVTASMAILLLASGGMFGALFVANFFLQDVLRLDPLATGLRVLPLTVLMVLAAPLAGAALRWYGPRGVAVVGTLLVAVGIVGLAILSTLGPTGPWWVGVATFAVLGAGFAAVMVTATGTVVGDAPPGYAGVVGGLKQTAMNLGPTLGIAVAASVMLLGSSRVGLPGSAVVEPGGVVGTGAGMGPTLLVLAGLAALALVPAALLPPRPKAAAGSPHNRPPLTVRPPPSCPRRKGRTQAHPRANPTGISGTSRMVGQLRPS